MIHEPVIIEKKYLQEILGRLEILEAIAKKPTVESEEPKKVISKEEAVNICGYSLHYLSELGRTGRISRRRVNGKEYGYLLGEIKALNKKYSIT